MAVVSKKDIEILTKQVLSRKDEILETIKREHTNIDPTLLPENFIPKFEEKLREAAEKECASGDDDSISLEDVENICHRFDVLDKKLSEPKASTLTTSNVGNTVAHKETRGLKRYGSITDINKTLQRSSSLLNLNATKMFAEPKVPARDNKPILSSGSDTLTQSSVDNTVIPKKISAAQLAEHNKILDEIQRQSEPNGYLSQLRDIGESYKSSFGRLNNFFNEVQQVQSKKSADTESNVSLDGLDEELLNKMKMLSQNLSQVRFMAENKHLYNAGGIEDTNSPLSDDLTDILEHFYRNN
ncbi:uncharacterized protein LOC116349958 [Contarinia nasturtii]|uniref:uncharacterized protein LOC116349958 n=1 Tax=Contarinia nasturtii TaxID=265458 RepID=UPI0012D439DF|nr:uncharacterized protein LOC116349958 [Contarinia nasturtii]